MSKYTYNFEFTILLIEWYEIFKPIICTIRSYRFKKQLFKKLRVTKYSRQGHNYTTSYKYNIKIHLLIHIMSQTDFTWVSQEKCDYKYESIFRNLLSNVFLNNLPSQKLIIQLINFHRGILPFSDIQLTPSDYPADFIHD